jgi:chorismate synthase
VEILSGIFEGRTTGAPLCGIIRNTNTRSKDYHPELPRPGHADLAAYIKYNGFADYRGGGHFSGRITGPLTFAGALCKQILEEKGIKISAKIIRLAGIEGDGLTPEMEAAVLDAKEQLDSVGGVISCEITGLPAGLGSPFFGSAESRLSAMMFSVPAVKGIEFGAGFSIADMRGSKANDPIAIEDGKFYTKSNNNGGINGGITNGMPLTFRVAIKPTPSIAQKQETVNLATMENETLEIHGRHDPCIVPRAVPVIEAAAAICILDMTLD